MELSTGEWIFIVGIWLIAIICGFIAVGNRPPDKTKEKL